jgi:3-hydroxy-3-methylglutaryl CoA synthase
MAAVIDRATAVDYFKSEATLLQWAGNSEDAITIALDAANGEVIAALRRSGSYDSSAISALVVATAPGELKSIALARFAHHLTKADAARPDLFTAAAEDAQKTLAFIATGNHIVESVTTAQPTIVRGTAPDLVFDNLDTTNGHYYRDVDL